eukprot:5432983-Amphidinium_carterae.1
MALWQAVTAPAVPRLELTKDATIDLIEKWTSESGALAVFIMIKAHVQQLLHSGIAVEKSKNV